MIQSQAFGVDQPAGPALEPTEQADARPAEAAPDQQLALVRLDGGDLLTYDRRDVDHVVRSRCSVEIERHLAATRPRHGNGRPATGEMIGMTQPLREMLSVEGEDGLRARAQPDRPERGGDVDVAQSAIRQVQELDVRVFENLGCLILFALTEFGGMAPMCPQFAISQIDNRQFGAGLREQRQRAPQQQLKVIRMSRDHQRATRRTRQQETPGAEREAGVRRTELLLHALQSGRDGHHTEAEADETQNQSAPTLHWAHLLHALMLPVPRCYNERGGVPMGSEIKVEICAGNACRDNGGLELLRQVERLYAGRADVTVIDTGCHYYCEEGPIAVIAGRMIKQATLAAVREAVSALSGNLDTKEEPQDR